MARRKGISNKSKSITAIRKTQQQLGNKTQPSKTQLIGNEERVPVKKESASVVHQKPEAKMAPTQVLPSSPAPAVAAVMTSANNNNSSADLQNKYLHKKFKRASAASVSPPSQASAPAAAQNHSQQGRDELSASSPTSQTAQTARHICPYCKLACAKPSVLQKHIRAHTNERPYPCEPCGFAFKTKSNLYKHCRSRAHYQRMRGGLGGAAEEDNASDADLSSSNASEGAPETPPPPPSTTAVATNTTNNSASKTPIYKPKFHKAALYRNEDSDELTNTSKDQQAPPAITSNASPVPNTSTAAVSTFAVVAPSSEADSLTRRISKIISQNEAIVDVVEPPLLQRKYGKINSTNSGGSPGVGSKLANALLRNDQSSNQPLNLSKPSAVALEQHSQQQQKERMRQRRYSESQPPPALAGAGKLDQHPQNPEGSIIKDLLLKARARGDAPFMLGDLSDDLGLGGGGGGGGSQYTCPLCRISFRGADNLETHRQYYCKGELNPAVGFQRSRSVNVQLPERYNPNTLAKLASSTLKAPSNGRRGQKPGDLRIVPPPLLDASVAADVTRVSAPLPSPGPLLGTTRLVANDGGAPPPKRARTEVSVMPAQTMRSLEDLCSSPLLRAQQQLGGTSSSLQMFGGEVRIVDDASGETKTLRIEPSSAQNSPAPAVIFTPTSVIAPPDTPGRIVVRSGLHSGGTMLHNPATTPSHAAPPTPLTPLTPGKKHQQGHQPMVSAPDVAPNITHFRFPPVAAAPSPAVQDAPAPQTIVHGGRLIPFVPGIPGPNTLNVNDYNALGCRSSPSSSPRLATTQANSFSTININKNSVGLLTVAPIVPSTGLTNLSVQSLKMEIPKLEINTYSSSAVLSFSSKNQNGFLSGANRYNVKITDNAGTVRMSESMKDLASTTDSPGPLKIDSDRSFNFTCIADNVGSDAKQLSANCNMDKIKITQAEERHFNFENFISKSEILNKSISEVHKKSDDEEASTKTLFITVSTSCSTNTVSATRTTETSYFRKNMDSILPNTSSESGKTKFLRPSSLPLKPGTFTPKKHHGITPNAHTLPLISPETPRPAKAFGQLYLNGHAYTYLGLKCSTRVYYCTLNRLQPMYVANQHTLSMYSNWRVCSEACPSPLKMTPNEAMAHYDSRHRPQRISIAKTKNIDILTHSSYWLDKNMLKNGSTQAGQVSGHPDDNSMSDDAISKRQDSSLTEGFESHEEYTYVRGRGRGKYVCSKCGIRCKKPSMLKKHARTHTDVRPFTCKHCAFSFKTKGNLTKHMKSKAHFKKCLELGINPVPTTVEEGDCVEPIGGSSESLGASGDSDSDTDTDGDEGNEGETESSDTDESKSRLPEHEAAHCLLSLSSGRVAPNKQFNITPGLLSASRPCTYPYSLQKLSAENNEKVIAAITPTKAQQYTRDQSAEHLNDNYKKTVLQTNNVKLVINSDRIEDNSSVKNNAFSQLQPECIPNTNSLRQNSVIITNQQATNNIYYKASCDSFQPIDLTKPRDKLHIETRSKSPMRTTKTVLDENDHDSVRIANAVTSANKNAARLSDERMFQVYLTEKALQETKIKQSQYTNNRIQIQGIEPNAINFNSKLVSSTETTNTIRIATSVITQASTSTTNVLFSRDTIHKPRISTGISESQILATCSMDKSGMDTLAEIAACSSKLETNLDVIANNTSDATNNNPKCAIDNAKIVASEYLKFTSEKSKNIENFEEKTDVGASKQIVALSKSSVSNTLDISPNDNQDLNDSSDQKLSSERMPARKVVVGAGGLSFKSNSSINEYSTSGNQFTAGHVAEESVCFVCSKTFSKPSHLRLHINIHYIERPFRCEACAVSFRTKGHLQKHERSVLHHNKVSMASTFGAPTTSNPRPFNCSDCKIAFRIHGHLAKHLRSKMHVMRLECLGKLPFGTYAEIERAGVSLTDIDTTDCDNSLASLQMLAQKLHEKDPTKQGPWDPIAMAPPLLPAGGESDSEGEPMSPQNSSEDFLKKTLDAVESVQTIDNLNNCNMCKSSFKTFKELEVHNYIEHSVQRIESASLEVSTSTNSDLKRKCDDIELYGKAMDNKRCKVTDS